MKRLQLVPHWNNSSTDIISKWIFFVRILKKKNNHNFSKVNICIFMQQFPQRSFFRTLQHFTRLLWQKSRDVKYTLFGFQTLEVFCRETNFDSCVYLHHYILCDHVFLGHTLPLLCICGPYHVGHTCICGSHLFLYLWVILTIMLCFALLFCPHWLVYLWWVILVSTRKVCPLQLFLRCPTFADPCRWTKQRFRQRRLRTDSLRRNPEMESLSTDVCFQCGYGQVLEGFHVVFLGNLCCCLYFVDICVNIVHWSEIALRCFDSRLFYPNMEKYVKWGWWSKRDIFPHNLLETINKLKHVFVKQWHFNRLLTISTNTFGNNQSIETCFFVKQWHSNELLPIIFNTSITSAPATLRPIVLTFFRNIN